MAQCQNGECKKRQIKIRVDAIRLGVWAEYAGLDGGAWKWRHWGCITDRVMRNVQAACGKNLRMLLQGYIQLTGQYGDSIHAKDANLQ